MGKKKENEALNIPREGKVTYMDKGSQEMIKHIQRPLSCYHNQDSYMDM